MLQLYIVRHGETEWNMEERIQGRLNSNLTAKGREYARLLGDRLKDIAFTQIITSPSQRALDTAELIRGNRDITIAEDERIMEMGMGPWQGLTTQEIKSQYPYEYNCFLHKPETYQNAEAESLTDMHQRAVDFLNELKNRSISGNVLVITHGLFIKALYAVFKGMKLKDMWMEPTVDGTSLTIVKIDKDQYEFLLEADMSHITKAGSTR